MCQDNVLLVYLATIIDNRRLHKKQRVHCLLVQIRSQLFTMSKIIAVLACLAVVLAVVSAESKPRYHKLEKLGCGLDQVILCAGEIEGEETGKNSKC